MKRYICLAVLLLCLAGCAHESTSPSPSPFASSPTAPTPTDVVAPASAVLTPTGLTVDLEASAGQALRLTVWELDCESLTLFPGFTDNTGYGTLEAPPKQVALYVRAYSGSLCCETFHTQAPSGEWSVLVLLTDAGRTGFRQEFILSREDDISTVTGEISFQDVNFDGFQDILINVGGGRGGQYYQAALLWRPELEAYAEAPSFSAISAAHLDLDHHVIWGGWDFSYAYTQQAYEYIDGGFVETHAIQVDHLDVNWENGKRCTEFALVDGVWTQVGCKEFPGSGEEFPAVMAEYIETGAIWSGWDWCNPWAFYRYG